MGYNVIRVGSPSNFPQFPTAPIIYVVLRHFQTFSTPNYSLEFILYTQIHTYMITDRNRKEVNLTVVFLRFVLSHSFGCGLRFSTFRNSAIALKYPFVRIFKNENLLTLRFRINL